MTDASGKRGLFITLEGIEGVGKSTQLAHVADWLRRHKREVVTTREPGGTELGERIRALLLDRRHTGMGADAELLMMFAARAEHLDKIIRPALARGCDVVCDRFTDATYAYQGGGRGIDMQRIAAIEALVQDGLGPDLTLLLDAEVPLALARTGNRGPADRFETEELEFFERVRAVYLERARSDPRRFRVVDASASADTVRARIEAVLAEVLP